MDFIVNLISFVDNPFDLFLIVTFISAICILSYTLFSQKNRDDTDGIYVEKADSGYSHHAQAVPSPPTSSRANRPSRRRRRTGPSTGDSDNGPNGIRDVGVEQPESVPDLDEAVTVLPETVGAVNVLPRKKAGKTQKKTRSTAVSPPQQPSPVATSKTVHPKPAKAAVETVPSSPKVSTPPAVSRDGGDADSSEGRWCDVSRKNKRRDKHRQASARQSESSDTVEHVPPTQVMEVKKKERPSPTEAPLESTEVLDKQDDVTKSVESEPAVLEASQVCEELHADVVTNDQVPCTIEQTDDSNVTSVANKQLKKARRKNRSCSNKPLVSSPSPARPESIPTLVDAQVTKMTTPDSDVAIFESDRQASNSPSLDEFELIDMPSSEVEVSDCTEQLEEEEEAPQQDEDVVMPTVTSLQHFPNLPGAESEFDCAPNSGSNVPQCERHPMAGELLSSALNESAQSSPIVKAKAKRSKARKAD